MKKSGRPASRPAGPGGNFRPAGAVFEDFFETLPENALLGFLGVKNGGKKVEIEGVGPIWREPRRNSA